MPVEHSTGGSVITGDAIGGFRGHVILKAIEFYLKTGMQVNRAYTPANMKRAAGDYTGKTYPRSRKGLETALADLQILAAGKTLDQLGALERKR